MLKIATKLESLSATGAIPFVIERGDTADYGYAASPWVLDLYRWALSDAVPELNRHRILGLLCGYNAEAIRQFEEKRTGRVFDLIASGESGSM